MIAAALLACSVPQAQTETVDCVRLECPTLESRRWSEPEARALCIAWEALASTHPIHLRQGLDGALDLRTALTDIVRSNSSLPDPHRSPQREDVRRHLLLADANGGLYDRVTGTKLLMRGDSLALVQMLEGAELPARPASAWDRLSPFEAWLFDEAYLPTRSRLVDPARPLAEQLPVSCYRGSLTLADVVAFAGAHPLRSDLLEHDGVVTELVWGSGQAAQSQRRSRFDDALDAVAARLGDAAAMADSMAPMLHRSIAQLVAGGSMTGPPPVRDTADDVGLELGFVDPSYDPLGHRRGWAAVLYVASSEKPPYHERELENAIRAVARELKPAAELPPFRLPRGLELVLACGSAGPRVDNSLRLWAAPRTVWNTECVVDCGFENVSAAYAQHSGEHLTSVCSTMAESARSRAHGPAIATALRRLHVSLGHVPDVVDPARADREMFAEVLALSHAVRSVELPGLTVEQRATAVIEEFMHSTVIRDWDMWRYGLSDLGLQDVRSDLVRALVVRGGLSEALVAAGDWSNSEHREMWLGALERLRTAVMQGFHEPRAAPQRITPDGRPPKLAALVERIAWRGPRPSLALIMPMLSHSGPEDRRGVAVEWPRDVTRMVDRWLGQSR